MAQAVDENGLVILPFVGCETSPLVNHQQSHTNSANPKKIIPKPLPSPAQKQKEHDIINRFKMPIGAGPSSNGPPALPGQLPRCPQPFPSPPQQFLSHPQLQTMVGQMNSAPFPSQIPPQILTNALLGTMAKMLPVAPLGYQYIINIDKMQPELRQLPPSFPSNWGSYNLPLVMYTPHSVCPPAPKMESRPVSFPVPKTPTGQPPANMPMTPPTSVTTTPTGTLAEALSRLQEPPAQPAAQPPVQPPAASNPSVVPAATVRRSTSEIENGTVHQESRTEFYSADPAPKRRKLSKKDIPLIELD